MNFNNTPIEINKIVVKTLIGGNDFTDDEIADELTSIVVLIKKHHLENCEGKIRIQRVPYKEKCGRVHTCTIRIAGTRKQKCHYTMNFPQNRLVNHLTGETKPLGK